jgi:hypothetical protein
MLTPSWRRRTARMILVAFGASSMGCGGSPSEPAASTTSTVVSTTMAPPSTLNLSEVPKALDAAELRKLVAPVALYPDVVLSSLLPATTYPKQLADAATWLDEQGGTVDAVPEDRGWDGSVAGLLQFPDVLRWAHQNEPWTDEMGSAMTYQQGAVLDAIQRYRKEVANAGNLESNPYQKVVRKGDDIRIQPAKPDKVYVPQYDPAAATEPQPASPGPGLNPWIVFGGGAVVGALGAWALYSIFNDDDDGGHGGRRVRKVNNYYYSGSNQPRPRAEAWTPRRRPRARRRAEAFQPTPLRGAQATEQRASSRTRTAGVRPPGTYQAAPAPVARPTGTPAKHHEAVQGHRRPKRGAKAKKGAKKKGKKNGRARNKNEKKSGKNGTKRDRKTAG